MMKAVLFRALLDTAVSYTALNLVTELVSCEDYDVVKASKGLCCDLQNCVTQLEHESGREKVGYIDLAFSPVAFDDAGWKEINSLEVALKKAMKITHQGAETLDTALLSYTQADDISRAADALKTGLRNAYSTALRQVGRSFS